MAKKKKDNNTIIFIIIGVAILLIIGNHSGLFKSITLGGGDDKSGAPNIPELQNEYQSFEVSFLMDPNIICTGSSSTGYITSNIPNGICKFYSKTGVLPWVLTDTINLNANGAFSQSSKVEVPGTLYGYVSCCDTSNNCKNSNIATLTVNDCGSTDNPSCIDSDGGQDDQFLTYGTCESSVTQSGTYDLCSGGQLWEQYCGSDFTCQTTKVNCENGWVCISGACRQPSCDTIINPTGQTSCDVGSTSEIDCYYVPANLGNPAHCIGVVI